MTVISDQQTQSWLQYAYANTPDLETCLGFGVTGAIGFATGGTSMMCSMLFLRYGKQAPISYIVHKGMVNAQALFFSKENQQRSDVKMLFNVLGVVGDALVIGNTGVDDVLTGTLTAGAGIIGGVVSSELLSNLTRLKEYKLEYSTPGRLIKFSTALLGGYFSTQYLTNYLAQSPENLTTDQYNNHTMSNSSESYVEQATSNPQARTYYPNNPSLKISPASNTAISSNSASVGVCQGNVCTLPKKIISPLKLNHTTPIISPKDKDKKEECNETQPSMYERVKDWLKGAQWW
ncbi:hypothetical protein D5018_13390 [Parashewanella curva]|uniref:Uncharacterized protein n=1 Tax=Parashewanella curva TaxID=2338552 RepID=A0A3L8PV65_9GAMM|nr:hypothetical protein [Parashewanella curva]RLV59204.1 hypothetical protein D5018_13390 [Parashewanella curva]